jgi:NADH-quinone oxidoreductase subunit K
MQSSLQAIGTYHYLLLSGLLFMIGMLGVLLRKNALVILMSIEIMLNAVNIAFVAFSRQNNDPSGQIMVFFVMAVAAAEAAIGLAIAIAIFKRFREINISFFENLKG